MLLFLLVLCSGLDPVLTPSSRSAQPYFHMNIYSVFLPDLCLSFFSLSFNHLLALLFSLCIYAFLQPLDPKNTKIRRSSKKNVFCEKVLTFSINKLGF